MAAVEFYIQHYQMNGTVVANETLIQTVPFTGEPVITNPKVKGEIGKAGSFEFGLELNSPYYNALLQMKTLFRVTLFGRTIFHGRVLTIDRNMARTRTVHCEGVFAFLLDSHQIGTKEEERPTIGVLQYLQQIIAQHNSDMTGEPQKQFTLGEVPGQYTGNTAESQRVTIPAEKAQQQFGDTRYNTSMDRLEGLLGDFGGYFRTRYDPNSGITYLDWYDKYYDASLNTQTIEVSKNLIDLSGSTEVDNLFTIVVPIGKGNDNESLFVGDYWPVVSGSHPKVNYITVPELATVPLYSDAELNRDYHRKSDYENAITRFGKIWKTVDFENANTTEKLFNYAKDWIKNNYMPEITQWSVTALDMRILGNQNQALYVGDRVNVVHPEVDQSYPGMTVISADYDLYNPEKNKYTIGIPNQEINAAYGVKNKVNKDSSGSGGSKKSGGGGSKKKPPENPTPAMEKDYTYLKSKMMTQYSLKTDWGQDIQLDDPLAYTIYNNYGEEIDDDHARQKAMHAAKMMNQTKATKRAELEAEAARRGCAWDDPQLVIDFTPALKSTQQAWKNAYVAHMVHDVGMSQEYAEILCNETAGQSLYASLVDDNGNWTAKAYEMNVPYEMGAEEVRAAAIKVRNSLSGKSPPSPASKAVQGITNFFGSLGINVGNYLGLDGESDAPSFKLGADLMGDIINTEDLTNQVTGLKEKGINLLNGLLSGNSNEKASTTGGQTWLEKGFNLIGGLFSGNNTENGGKEFDLNADTAHIDGKQNAGSAEFGTGGDLQNGRKVTINKAFSYTATVDGVTKTFTVPAGSIALDDLHFTKTYDSVYAKFLATDQLVAAKATITSLSAVEAKIDNITGNTIAASTQVRAATGAFTNLYGANIYYKPPDMGAVNIVSSIVSSYKFVESSGSIYLQGVRIGGSGWENLANFNIAATNKYLTDVAAARINGRNSVYVNNVSVDAGETKTVNLHYTDPQTGHEMNTGQSFTVSAGEGSSANLYGEDRTFTYNDTWTFTPKNGYDGFSEFIVRVKVPKSNTGCFVAGSSVKLFNGEERPIEELTVGTHLLSYNEETERYTETEILAVQTFKHKSDIHEIHLSNGKKVTLTGSHPVLTKEGWKAINVPKAKEEHFVDVSQLLEGDEILAEEGIFVKAVRIVCRDDLTDCNVYNLDVEPVDTYIVDGVVVHNADSK